MNEQFEDERENVISATECTGLLPALPEDGAEAQERAARLYAVHTPARKEKGKCERKRAKKR